jgi:hypothetical protein
MTSDELLGLIRTAFVDCPRPRGDIVTSDELEPKMVRQLFGSKRWNDISTELLNGYDQRADLSAVVAFLSDEANRYYLPAFMTFIVCDAKGAGLLLDVLLSRLGSGRSGLSPMYFSSTQRGSVNSFLRYLYDLHFNDESTRRAVEHGLALWADVPTGTQGITT